MWQENIRKVSFAEFCAAWFQGGKVKAAQSPEKLVEAPAETSKKAMLLFKRRKSTGTRTVKTTPDFSEAEWIDVRQAKQIFCLGKTTLYHLAGSGKIISVSLRQPGCERGKRLFLAASIRTFLNGLTTTS